MSVSSSGELSPSRAAYPLSFFSFLSFRRPRRSFLLGLSWSSLTKNKNNYIKWESKRIIEHYYWALRAAYVSSLVKWCRFDFTACQRIHKNNKWKAGCVRFVSKDVFMCAVLPFTYSHFHYFYAQFLKHKALENLFPRLDFRNPL